MYLGTESESDLFTGTIHGNTDCYLQFCAPRLPQGAVSGRVSAAARVRPACAGLSLGRLALVTPTCLLVATSLLSIYRYPKSFTHYSRRPHAPPSPGRHPVVSSYLAGAAFAVPRCHCTVVVVVADQVAATGAPSRSSPLPTSSSSRRYQPSTISYPVANLVASRRSRARPLHLAAHAARVRAAPPHRVLARSAAAACTTVLRAILTAATGMNSTPSFTSHKRGAAEGGAAWRQCQW